MTYNNTCPACNGPVLLVGFTVRECEMPIRDNGWSVMATQRNTGGSEHFSCPTCMVTVPAEWVYKGQSQKEAVELMKGWGANAFSIHNRKPLPTPEELARMEAEAKANETPAEPEKQEVA